MHGRPKKPTRGRRAFLPSLDGHRSTTTQSIQRSTSRKERIALVRCPTSVGFIAIMAPASAHNPAYAKDERVLCFHHELLYEAKVLDSKPKDPNDKREGHRYRIHYKGWKNTCVRRLFLSFPIAFALLPGSWPYFIPAPSSHATLLSSFTIIAYPSPPTASRPQHRLHQKQTATAAHSSTGPPHATLRPSRLPNVSLTCIQPADGMTGSHKNGSANSPTRTRSSPSILKRNPTPTV